MPMVSIMLYLLWLCILVEIIMQSPLQKKFIYSQVLFIHWSVFRFEININNINTNIVPNYFSLTEYQNESAVYIDRSGSSFFCKVDSILISTSVHVFFNHIHQGYFTGTGAIISFLSLKRIRHKIFYRITHVVRNRHQYICKVQYRHQIFNKHEKYLLTFKKLW